MAVRSLENTLTIHVVAVPVFFVVISLIYFKKLNYTAPLQTAILFLCFVVFMDVFVVALLVRKSFEMFASILGTWISFALISTLSNGFICSETYVNRNNGLTRCKRLRCASPKLRVAGLVLQHRR